MNQENNLAALCGQASASSSQQFTDWMARSDIDCYAARIEELILNREPHWILRETWAEIPLDRLEYVHSAVDDWLAFAPEFDRWAMLLSLQEQPKRDRHQEMLLKGDSPTLRTMLRWAPDKPLVLPPNPDGELDFYILKLHAWRALYRGYQADRDTREDMKYGYANLSAEPLKASVIALINFSKVQWFKAIDRYNRQPQFAPWLCSYIDDLDGPPWSGLVRGDQAFELLRIACRRYMEG